MNKLDEKELKELAELEELEALERQDQELETKNIQRTPEEKAAKAALQGIDVSVEPTAMEAFSAGVVEGVPFMKDAIAVAGAFQDESKTFSEEYSANMKDINATLNKAESDSPWLFTGGDIASGFAIPAAKSLQGAIAFGGLSSLSRSEDRGPADFIAGAAMGGVLKAGSDIVAQKTASVANKASKNLGIIADETFKDAVDNNKNRQVLNDHIDEIFPSGDKAEKAKKYVDYLKNKGFFEDNDNVESTLNKFKQLHKDANNKIEEIIKVKNRELTDVEVTQLHDDLLSKFDLDTLRFRGEEGRADKIEKYVKDLFFTKPKYERQVVDEVIEDLGYGNKVPRKIYGDVLVEEGKPKKLDVARLHKLKRGFGEDAKNSFDKASSATDTSLLEIYKKANLTIGKALPEFVEDNALKEANLQWMIANQGEELTQETLSGMSGGAISKIRNAFNIRNMLAAASIGGGATAGAMLAGPAGAVTGAGAAYSIIKLNNLIKDPNVHSKIGNRVVKVAEHLRVNPESPYFNRLVVAAGLSNDKFRDAFSSVVSEISLMENAIARDVEDVKAKSSDILQVLQYHSPEDANAMRDALEADDNEAIAMIADKLSKMPQGKDFFEEGRGFNGKVYDEAEKQAMIKEVEGMDISLKQKLEHKKNLRDNNLIPVLQQEPDRFIQSIYRDKSKSKY